MIGLIDADSIVYIIGYNNREHIEDPSADVVVRQATGDMVRTMLTLVHADSYVGVFSPSKTFRNEVYKYAPYKGTRNREVIEWKERFEPVIKNYLRDAWGFITVPSLEADDVICALAEYYSNQRDYLKSKLETGPNVDASEYTDKYDWIILSPDKDLRQIAGLHYDYKKEGAIPYRVTEEEAHKLFWISMLTGDTSDNVCGVPGLGPVKAETLIKNCEDDFLYEMTVMGQYTKYFGSYYGPIIYQETKDTLQLMSTKHRLWREGGFDFAIANQFYGNSCLKTFEPSRVASPFEQAADQIQRVLDEDLLSFFGE